MSTAQQLPGETSSGACFWSADPPQLSIDPNGNLIQKIEGNDTWTYEWDAENRLKRVLKNAAEVARFSYDPAGRRVEKVAGGVTASYAYDGIRILRESMSSGSTRTYLHGPAVDEPLAVEDGSGTFNFFHVDALGSVAKLTSSTGAVSLSRQYDAFGNLQIATDVGGYAFTGREWDPEIGLYYYRARFYDPKAGRFLSEDPLGFDGGVNFYTYVRNRPINRIDPLGMQDANRALPVKLCPAGSLGNANGALCCDGNGGYALCADTTKWPKYSERMQYCVQQHEMSHARDIPKTCEGCNTPSCTPVPAGGRKSATECRAWRITYLCFRNSGERDPDDGELWEEAARRNWLGWCRLARRPPGP